MLKTDVLDMKGKKVSDIEYRFQYNGKIYNGKGILFDNLEKVAQSIHGASKHLPKTKEPIKVVLCGGLCAKDGIIHRVLCEVMAKENYSISICEHPLIFGALRLAGMR